MYRIKSQPTYLFIIYSIVSLRCFFYVKVCSGTDSCTKQTTYGVGAWLGSGQNFTVSIRCGFVSSCSSVQVVDTPGFGDSNNDDDLLIEEMMDILANVVDHTNTFLLLFDGRETRFDASLQNMIQRMTMIFGRNWWNYLVIGVSFWAYDQNSIDARQCYPEYPEYCHDEKWFCGEMNRQIQEKFNVGGNFSCVFTDSWSQTPGPPGFNTEDPTQQEHWKAETGVIWEITTGREDSFSFMTIDDILEENARLKEENNCLNDVIRNNITHLTEMIASNAHNIENNAQNIQNNADNIGIVDSKVNANVGDITQTNRRVDENKYYIDQNIDDIAALNLNFSAMNLAPIGTISAWVTKPSMDTELTVSLPEGWVRWDFFLLEV